MALSIRGSSMGLFAGDLAALRFKGSSCDVLLMSITITRWENSSGHPCSQQTWAGPEPFDLKLMTIKLPSKASKEHQYRRSVTSNASLAEPQTTFDIGFIYK
ncbi:hypothetical protein E4U55_001044 [Claviceps digitariae]|nr:hypothetical protein E4U55_001044 [Claviceps digitariae]